MTESDNIHRSICLMWEYKEVDGPFATLDEIPLKIFELVDEDPDYTLEVWRDDWVDHGSRRMRWWREDEDV